MSAAGGGGARGRSDGLRIVSGAAGGARGGGGRTVSSSVGVRERVSSSSSSRSRSRSRSRASCSSSSRSCLARASSSSSSSRVKESLLLLREDQRESSALESHSRGCSRARAGAWLPAVHPLPVSERPSSPVLALMPDWRDGSPVWRGSE